MARLHQDFEWDEDKAAANPRKHDGVTFDDAARVLEDVDGDHYHVEELDRGHSDTEDRYITTAAHPDDRGIVLVFCWTDRSIEDESVTRIISARVATRRERRLY